MELEFAATQIYEDDDFPPTQRISHTSDNEEEEPVQVGTLHIDSKEYKIKKGTTTIGRLNSCDIVLSDATVSKTHAEIEAMKNQGSKIWICDLNSSNKTKLDDETLIANRFYEIRDGSVIQFGRKVVATYHTYRSAVIPETPAPSRRKVTDTIIPSTPDSSLNTSSGDDGSIIYGTQRNEENNVFRRPLVPQRQSTSIDKKNISPQCQSTNIDKNNISHTSLNESDKQTAIVSHVSNIKENGATCSIFDIETQKFEGNETVASNSIHDIETQAFPADASIQVNTKANEQLQSKLNDQDEESGTSATNIYDMETQHYTSKSEDRKEDNIRNKTPKKLTIDIYNAQTQNYHDDGNNTKNSEIDKNENQKKNLDQVECNINDLETQKLDNNAEDISNVETQLELNGTKNTNTNIFDMETQLVDIVNNINNDEDNTNKDTTAQIKNKINDDNVLQSPNSRSSSPGSLNLSSPGIDEDCRSLLQHSDHLFESSDLLEYFNEGLDKQEEIRASNTSTPKSYTRALSERDTNAESERNTNVENISNNDEDNIFDAPTQRFEKSDEISEKDASPICKLSKKRESKKNIDDDSEIDTEEHSEKLAKKQSESLEISNKSCKDNTVNKNDIATSVESEDIFDALTQQSNNLADKDTSNSSSVNRSSKINETDTVVDAMAPTQIINNDENTEDQSNLTNKLLADINSNNNAIEDGQKKHVDCKKPEEAVQAITNDSVEEKLNEMFENVNGNSIHEPSHISTQTLEDILESSCDNLSPSKSAVNESSHTNNVSQMQLEKKNSAGTEANNIEIDSQNSDIFFSALTTKRKKNILKDTQELDSTQNVIPHRQASNTSLTAEVDNETVRNTKKKLSRSRNKSETTTDTSSDDNVTETTSNGNNERNLRRSTRKKRESTPKYKRILRGYSGKVDVDDVEKDLGSVSNVCVSHPLEHAKRTRTSDMYDSDDDILTRLPAVRISGTLSNPASSSASSTSSVHSSRKRKALRSKKEKIQKQVQEKENSLRSERSIIKDKNKAKLCEQTIEDFEKDESPNRIHDKPSVSSLDNHISNTLKTNKIVRHDLDTSEDSDSETNYKRFKQMADRMLNNDYLKRCNERNVENKTKSARFLPNLSNDPNRDIDDESKSSSQTTSRMTRHSSGQSNKRNVSRREASVENEIDDKSTKSEPKSIERKRTIETIEKNIVDEQTNFKKRKAYEVEEGPILTRTRKSTVKTTIDKQSPNTLGYFSSRSNSPVIGSTRFSRSNKTVPETTLKENQKIFNLEIDENIDSEKSFIIRNKHKNDSQAAMHINDGTANKSSNSIKQAQEQESKTEINLSQDKILKVVLSPLKSRIINLTEDESQEVEIIMERNLNNVQDKNLSIRETNTAKIFQRRLRIRSRQLDADTKTDSTDANTNTDSTSIESSMSSISDSNNTESDDSTSTAKKPRRFTKSSIRAQVSKKEEMFKKPARVNTRHNSSSSVFNSSTEYSPSESNESSISDTLLSSRTLRSKVAGVREKERVTRSTCKRINNSILNMNTSIEITSLPSTSSTRTSRSMSVLNNSMLSAEKPRILFTGITEDYSNIIKTLGGNKVEDPAKCSILVTDKVRRTYKFLCALAKGIPIVAINWLKDSESAARFLDWESYILKDPAAEAKFGFRLRKSLDKAKKTKLLDGYTILLTSNIAQPPIKELKDMITSCGGKALLRPPNKWPEKVIIISCKEDLLNAKKLFVKAPQTTTIQSTEFILTGILKQEMDFEKYKIT